MKDAINKPEHYLAGDIECINVMLATQGVKSVKGFCINCVIKYVFRHKQKNGLEDIKKAYWYLGKYIELSEKKCTTKYKI